MHMNRMLMPSLLLAFSAIMQTPTAQEIHVSPSGNDRNTGTESQPLRTLTSARDRMRTLRADPTRNEDYARVIIHGGVYDLAAPLALDARDGGTPEHPLVWTAVPGEKVSITGGRTLRSDRFRKVTDDDVLQRLDPTARLQVMQIDLRAEGVKDSADTGNTGTACPSSLRRSSFSSPGNP